jgi:chloramphenicol 3-O-phosphotransferase
MRISIRNFRGCERADLDVSRIALLSGSNASGKSSVAQAVGATLAASATFGGLSRDAAGLLVRKGAAEASVTVEGEKGTASMSWPRGLPGATGTAPWSSEYAAGLTSIVSLPPRDRARALAVMLRADPTREDLGVALDALGFSAEHADRLWQRIVELGWDGAHASRKDLGAQLKGQWRGITNLNYGSKQAVGWRPDLVDLNRADLAAAVARARVEVDNAVRAEAVSSARREQIEAEAGALEQRRQDAQRAEAEAEERAQDLRAAQSARQALPPAEGPRTVPCPHCNAPLIIDLVGLRLEPVSTAVLTDADVKARRQAIATAEGKLAHAQDAVNLARHAVSDTRAAVERAETAADRLRNWPAAVEAGTDIEAARQTLRAAETRLADYDRKVQADELHEKISGNEDLLDVLAGDGLRAKLLAQRLDVFNGKQLKALTDAAGWSAVKVEADMTVYLDCRPTAGMWLPYALLSTSEQYRVRVVLQVAAACLDGSDLVVIDAADVLDTETRPALFDLLDASGCAALICSTAARRDRVPDLAALDLGVSYWVAGGIAEPLAAAAKVAA